MESQEIRLRIRNFISTVFQGTALEDRDDIFTMGHVNSLFAMELVLFVEREFAIEISDEDIDIKNFRSIDSMAGFVLRKKRMPVG